MGGDGGRLRAMKGNERGREGKDVRRCESMWVKGCGDESVNKGMCGWGNV